MHPLQVPGTMPLVFHILIRAKKNCHGPPWAANTTTQPLIDGNLEKLVSTLTKQLPQSVSFYGMQLLQLYSREMSLVYGDVSDRYATALAKKSYYLGIIYFLCICIVLFFISAIK